MSEAEQAVEDVKQAWRRLRPIARAGLRAEQPDLADALNRLDSTSRFDLDMSD